MTRHRKVEVGRDRQIDYRGTRFGRQRKGVSRPDPGHDDRSRKASRASYPTVGMSGAIFDQAEPQNGQIPSGDTDGKVGGHRALSHQDLLSDTPVMKGHRLEEERHRSRHPDGPGYRKTGRVDAVPFEATGEFDAHGMIEVRSYHVEPPRHQIGKPEDALGREQLCPDGFEAFAVVQAPVRHERDVAADDWETGSRHRIEKAGPVDALDDPGHLIGFIPCREKGGDESASRRSDEMVEAVPGIEGCGRRTCEGDSPNSSSFEDSIDFDLHMRHNDRRHPSVCCTVAWWTINRNTCPRAGVATGAGGHIDNAEHQHFAWLARSFGRTDYLPLTPDDLSALSGAGEYVEKYPGTHLFREETQAVAAYVVQRGQVELYRTRREGRRVVGRVGMGGVIGDIAMFQNQPYISSARAVDAVVAFRLDRQRLIPVLLEHPTIAMRWLVAGLTQLESMQRRVLRFMHRTVREQVAEMLVDEADRYGEVHLSQTSLATLLGASRQSVE